MTRAKVVQLIGSRLARMRRPHTVRIGIDGVDGAGKTTLADELVEPIEKCGRTVLRASIDGFHNPRQRRYRSGRFSPRGYYHDSFDYEALRAVLLEPLGPGGSGVFQRAVFDHRVDSAVQAPVERVAAGAILLFDGVFLQRPELTGVWDATIFLDVPFSVSVARMAARDGGDSDPEAPLNKRYVEGQKLYLRECRPRETAAVVVDNTDLEAPRVVGA